MKITGSHALPVDVQRAYEMVLDPDVLARALPGCDELVRIGPDEYEMRLKVAIAGMQGLFSGTVRITDRQPPDSYRMAVEASGRLGFVKGEGLMKLSAQNGATELNYEGDVQVGGMIAGVGQRLLDTSARMIIKRFMDKLSEEVNK